MSPRRARAGCRAPRRTAAPAYGEPINLETGEEGRARPRPRNRRRTTGACAIAVTGPSGDLVYFEQLDNTANSPRSRSRSTRPRAAATFRRPTKVFEDRVAQGGAGVAALTLDGVIASEGGIPIVVGGKIIGAIGCSGGTGQQDGVACQAGVNALK